MFSPLLRPPPPLSSRGGLRATRRTTALEAEKKELAATNARIEFDLKKSRDRVTELEAAHRRQEDRVHALEEQLREAELHGSSGGAALGGTFPRGRTCVFNSWRPCAPCQADTLSFARPCVALRRHVRR